MKVIDSDEVRELLGEIRVAIKTCSWEKGEREGRVRLWGGTSKGWRILVGLTGYGEFECAEGTAVKQGTIMRLPPDLLRLARDRIRRDS
jgi:hypothetical protein